MNVGFFFSDGSSYYFGGNDLFQKGFWLFIWTPFFFAGWLIHQSLDMKVRSPRLGRVLLGTVGLGALLSLGAFGLETVVPPFLSYWSAACALLFTVAMVLAVRADRRRYGMFCLSWLVTTVGFFLVAARGRLDWQAATQVAVMMGYALLGLSVAQRARWLTDQREAALKSELAAARRSAALADTFQRYVPMDFLSHLDTPDIVHIQRGDQVEKEMTVFFSDIRGFTTLTEKLTPAETFNLINDYLAAMAPQFHAWQGFIDKYIGDAIMGLFAAGQADDSADRAVRCAIGNLAALEAHNRAHREAGKPELAIGIGLHTGPVMLGMLGSDDRLNATVLGDAVNLASRVEGMTRLYGARILITEATRAGLRETYGMRPIDRVRVKGKTQPVDVYEVFEGTEQAQAKATTLTRFAAAFEAYVAGRLPAAREGFAAVLEVFDDPASALYLQRCDALERAGVPDDWDGVTTMTAK